MTSPHTDGRRARRPLLLAAALGGVSILVPGVLRRCGIDDTTTSVIAAGMDVAAALGAAAMLTAVRRRRRGTERTAWTALAIGPAAWAAGSMIWIGYLVAGQPLPAPSTADLCYLLMPISWCIAAVMVSGRPASGSRRARTLRTLDLLDSLIVALSMLVVLWVLAVRVSGLDLSDRAALMTLVYPVADSVVVTLLVRAIRRGTTDRRALGLLVAGMAVCTVGDLAFLVVAHLTHIVEAVPTLVDSAWVTGFALVGGGAWIALGGREAALAATDAAHLRRQVGSGRGPLLMGAFAATAGLADLAVSDGGTWSVATLVLVMVLLLSRQTLTLRENRRLSVELLDSIRALEQQAGHDPLTSLPNRRHLLERLHGLIAASEPSTCSAILFLDIDLLKAINDGLGHRQGDRLIRVVAARLHDRWPDDVVRFGGDEFVVLLRRRATLDAVAQESEELVEEMGHPDGSGDVVLQPSISVGVAAIEPGITPDELLRRADVALYHVKQAGRGRAELFHPSMDDSVRRQVEIESHLRGAIDAGELELHYQPVVELSTGRATGAEALLRWRHPDLGLLTPDRFLATAESLGLLRELGRRSLLEATRRLAELQVRAAGRPVGMSVNLSACEIDAAVIHDVEEALRVSAVDPSTLTLEITEDVIVDDSVRRTLTQLRRLGVGIAIDDFGTGNSSLRQLAEYPATMLKIDRSFVREMAESCDDRSIVAAIVELAGRLGLATVAEGVETSDQADLLAAVGVGHVQGWLFGRAVPFDELVQRWFDGSGAPVAGRPDQADAPSPQSRRRASSAPSMIRSSRSATDGSSSMTPTT